MKKILSLILLAILTFTLAGCSNHEYVSYVENVSYELFDYYVIGKREVVEFDYDYLKEVYDYDDIAYQIENDRIVEKTYYGHIKGKDCGKSLVRATLYKNNVPFQNLVLGYFVVVDYESDLMLPITSYTQFSTLESNNHSFFYLASDIRFPNGYDYEMIEEFNGVLINPYNYKISNVQNTEALFDTLDHAFIHGLIIEDSSFTGTDSASLAKTAIHSYLSEIHVFNVTVNGSDKAAGLVVNSKDTVYIKDSFEGSVTAGNLAAGLMVNADNGSEGYDYFIKNFVLNSYAYADLEVTNSGYAAGLVGEIKSNGIIESSYYVGDVTSEAIYPISKNLDDSLVYYVNAYTSIPTTELNKEVFGEGKIYGLADDVFFTGTILPGLEEFTFEAGQNPKN